MVDQANVNAPSQTTEEVMSLPIMKIRGTNYQVEADESLYPEGLQMLVVALKSSVLSTAMFNSFLVPLSWLSQAGSTATYSKALDVITFNLVNDKKVRMTKKLFCQILDIPNYQSFTTLSTAQVNYMFNEMGHQPRLTKISDFKKSGLPTIWNFLFGIFLRCLTSRTFGLDKGRMEVYAMVSGLYYDIPVDYSIQLWKEFQKSVENSNVVQGIFCARYWSLILRYFYDKEGIQAFDEEETAEFMKYHFPNEVSDDEEIFAHVARIPVAMLKKVDPSSEVLLNYITTIDPTVHTGKLLIKEGACPSKKSRNTKKPGNIILDQIVKKTKTSKSPKSKADEIVSIVVVQSVAPVVTEPTSIIIPSKSGVFRRLKLNYGGSPT